MKIRTDFVTNSSSSSFVALSANNKTLATILKKYEELFEDDCCETLNINEDSIEIYLDECWADIPSKKEEILASLLSVFGCEYYDEEDGFDEDDCYGNKIELIKEIVENAEKVTEDMEYFQMSLNDIGWQGDSDARYYTENYDEETLAMYYEWIAEEKGCTVEEVTEEDFNEWVGDKVSTEETTYTYDRKTGKEENSHSFTVE